jgi:hypothetical protein
VPSSSTATAEVTAQIQLSAAEALPFSANATAKATIAIRTVIIAIRITPSFFRLCLCRSCDQKTPQTRGTVPAAE